jgi:4-amino-4-deoxy-L-arabinose transferase-like glycosyltransferase
VEEYGFSHLDYPLLCPFLTAGIYASIGESSQIAGKILYIPLFVFFALFLYSSSSRRIGKNTAFALSAILLSSPAVLQWSAAGTADIYLAVFYSLAIFYSIRYIETKNSLFLSIAVMANISMVFSKNEGLPLALMNILGLLFLGFSAGFSKKENIRILFGMIIGIVILSPWFIWSYDIPKIHENYPSQILKIFSLNGITRIPEIANNFFLQPLALSRWGLFWFMAAMFFVKGVFLKRMERGFIFSCIMLGGQLALYFFIFIITPWTVGYLTSSALERLFVHLAIPAFFVCTCAALLKRKM